MPNAIEPIAGRRPLQVVGDEVTPLLSQPSGELFDVVGPEGSGPPPHAHPWDEGYVVLDGRLGIHLDGDDLVADAGTTVTVPAGTVHGYTILSPTARFLIATGGTGAGRFFADVDASVAPGPPTDESLLDLIEVAKRNELTSPLF
jgi:quercetin dioxygenase-like cupin family protein